MVHVRAGKRSVLVHGAGRRNRHEHKDFSGMGMSGEGHKYVCSRCIGIGRVAVQHDYVLGGTLVRVLPL